MQINTIVQECLEGNEGAWKMLVDTYSKRIFNMAYQFAGSYQEAEDLTQDIFLKLYNSLSKFDFKRNFSAWLLTIARNYLIDQYRRTKWEKQTRDNFNDHYLTSEAFENPEEGAVKEENKRTVWQGINNLTSEIRMAIILRDIQGKQYEEIAEIMSLPLGTVKSRINRGRLQLAKILKEKKERRNEM
ncbi:MAG TPA: sigma-70 family RNA polymerase sigma factor [Candidatus Aminicenantes bacterium]|nr:sigma-70 family RNA polymerase sigma factor [Candidatus Aminicenantes bacterium]HEB36659.1 sigma-70 family RNA polymerase sigma factor [Candidatus Aminicenantes bacterium]